jgi:hypothetical protein
MKRLSLCLCSALLFAASLPAQDEGTPEARQAKGRMARFVYTNLPEGLENPVSIMSGKDISQVLLSKLSPSDPVKIPADGILRIVRKAETQTSPDKPEYVTLAQANVPENVKSAMIILMPVAKNSKGLLFQSKVQDLDALKGGDCMFLNMTNLKIGIEFGKTSILVEPGKDKVHNPLGSSQTLSLPIRLSYFHPEKQKWAMITASTVALYSTRRELCIFNWDTRFNRVDYESITFPMTF